MVDVYMIICLIICYGLFTGFLAWCSKDIDQSGGGSQ